MRSAAFLFSALLLAPESLAAQVEAVPASGRTVGAFVPPGYFLLREASGHLNGDEHQDAVIIVGDRRERVDSMVENLGPRLLIVLHGTENGYRLGLATDAAVLGKHDGGAFGDPLDDLALERNVIVLSHYGGSAWRWRYTHRFRYQAGDYRLIGRTAIAFFNGRRCEKLGEFRPTTFVDENYQTRRRYSYQVPEGRCARLEKRGPVPDGPLRALRDFDIARDIER